MRNKIIAGLLGLVLGFGSSAADRLAIAEPVNKGGMKAEETEAVWGMLEATVDGGYELISRSALKAILTEIGLTTSSDLVNLNSAQKARLGELKTVKYLLVTTLSRFGSRINISLMVVNASTGEIEPDRKASETVDSLDELNDKLKDLLYETGLGSAAKKRGRSALLNPVIKVSGAPNYLREDFNVRLEESLLENGIQLQNLQSVTKILRKNRIGNLNEVEPALYRRVGELLRVDYLIQPTISRFSCERKKVYIEVTRQHTVRWIGNIEGSIRIISASTGVLAASIPFRQKVDFDDLDDTEDWTAQDYGKYLIRRILPQVSKKVLAKLK